MLGHAAPAPRAASRRAYRAATLPQQSPARDLPQHCCNDLAAWASARARRIQARTQSQVLMRFATAMRNGNVNNDAQRKAVICPKAKPTPCGTFGVAARAQRPLSLCRLLRATINRHVAWSLECVAWSLVQVISMRYRAVVCDSRQCVFWRPSGTRPRKCGKRRIQIYSNP